ncbi:MAG TPA: HAD family hydrolase [Acidimicrobiia bacterium]|nr:HAD family hydrolase [Acidimicrobiia bacterium]
MERGVSVVVFDVGETIVSEARIWTRWAERLGVRPFDFHAALGALIERGRPHREVFEFFSPGFDVDAAMAEDPVFGAFDADDLYADVRPCFEALRAQGHRIAIAGNQPERAEDALKTLDLGVDFVAASRRWGVEKPSPEFFAKVVEAAGAPPEQIAYVGDRVDNDVLPARDAGMVAVFIRRGPWGWIQSKKGPARWAHITIDSLTELPGALGRAAGTSS